VTVAWRDLREALAAWAYDAGLRALQPLLRRKLRHRGRQEPGYLEAVEERFGRYGQPPDREGGYLWVHAVSLGETRAAALLLGRLRQRWPGMRLLLTHGTATGRAEGRRLLRPGDVQVWQPWDTRDAVGRFLAQFRPAAGLLMETEVWPNLVEGCQRVGVPLLLVNARLNERSFERARRWAAISGPAYRGLTAVYAQTAADAERLEALGARVAGVFGNLKFDVPWHPTPWDCGRALRARLGGRRVVLLASWRDGEENQWFQALQTAPGSPRQLGAKDVLWVVVPRHPQRFDEVHAGLVAHGWRVWRRSSAPASAQVQDWPEAAWEADVWLGDSMGEMPLYYGLADLAWLGGSFAPLGGQNLIEAAACECPVVMGPHTFNFAEAASAAQATGAAVAVADMVEALAQTQRWLESEPALASARVACRTLIDQGAGAADRYADAVAKWFTGPASR